MRVTIDFFTWNYIDASFDTVHGMTDSFVGIVLFIGVHCQAFVNSDDKKI